MKVNIIIDHTDFKKIEEIANEYRYQKGYEFLAKSVDQLRDHLQVLNKLLNR